MARRPATTVLLLTRQSIVRADFTAANKPAGLWSQPRPDVQEWPTLVEIALGLGPKAGTRVFVLTSDLWTQTLTLSNISVTRMSQEELASALNFEAEALSGHSAFESTVGVRTLLAGQGYWIVQGRKADFEHVNDIIDKAGCRLGGIGHPGGLPAFPPEVDKGSRRWTRMEFWPDAVVFLRSDTTGAPVVQVQNSDPQLGRWKSEWAAWCQGFATTEQETLAGPGMPMLAAKAAHTFSLDAEEHLSRWLSAWAAALTGKTANVPLIRPASKPLSSRFCWTMAVAAGVVAIAACAGIHYSLDAAVQQANAELKKMQEQGKQWADLQKQIDDQKTRQKNLQTQSANLEQSVKVLSLHRQRVARLLSALRAIHPQDLYVEKIVVDSGEPRLHGHCLQPELADQFANKLAQAVRDDGWEIQSPKTEALKLAANGGPWSFDIQLRSAPEMTLDTRADRKKAKGK